MAELAKSNLTLAIHNRDLNIFNSSLPPGFYSFIKDRIVTFTDQKIKDSIDNRDYKYAMLLRKTDSQYVSRKPANIYQGKPLFYTMPQCPLPCFIVYGLRYGSPYLPRINYILYHLIQGGILQYWSKTEEFAVDRNRLGGDNKDKKPLTITNLQEMFYVLLIGEFISTVVFVLEILLHKLTKNK